MIGFKINAWGRLMWFGNLRLLVGAPTNAERFDAFSKIFVSALAVAFVAAAFSDIDLLQAIPERVTVAVGGIVGFLLGAAKFA